MMKKTVLASLLMVFSLGAIAEQGGFEGGKTPPPQKQQDAGYKGSEDTGQTHIEQIRDFRQGGYVTLEGYIVKKLSGDNYQFRDSTGTITIKAAAGDDAPVRQQGHRQDRAGMTPECADQSV